MDPHIRIILDELRRRLRERYGDRFDRLVLFGSRARGDAGPDSDIDVLVVLRGRVRAAEEILRSGDIVAAISLENDVVLSCVFVSRTRYRRERSPLLLNIRREGVPL